jgi:hypothetical protein
MSLHLFQPVICGILPNWPLYIIMPIIYIVIPVAICFFFIKWKNQSLDLKREQNDLLREVIKKLESK